MPTPTKGPRLGGSPAHERIILRNLASQLFENGKVLTTEAKAKRVRPYAEKLITKAKRGDLHGRRLILKDIPNKDAIHELYATVVPAVKDREGGYLRITKVGIRKGDGAPIALVEVIKEPAKKTRRRRKPKVTEADATSIEEKVEPQSTVTDEKTEDAEVTKPAEETKAE